MRILSVGFLAFSVSLVMNSNCFVSAQDASPQFISTLPADGTWAEYRMKSKNGPNEAEMISLNGRFRISSVGRATVNGRKCRWIECFLEQSVGNKGKMTLTTKVLVDEQGLRRNEGGDDIVLRVWVQEGDNSPTEIPKGSILWHPFAMLPKKAVELQSEIIDIAGLGRFQCHLSKAEERADENGIQSEEQIRIWSSEKSPFGTVKLEQKEKRHSNRGSFVGEVTLILDKIGKGATSELPGLN